MAVSQGEEEVRLTEEEEANTDHHHLHVAKALVNCVTEINDFGVDAVVDHLDTEFGKGVFECIEHLDHGFLARTKLIEEEHKSRDDREDENEGEGEHERQVHKAHESPEQALETTVGNAIQAALGPCTVLGGRVLVDVRLRLRRLGLANLREGDLHLGCELVGRRVQEVVGLGRHAKVGAARRKRRRARAREGRRGTVGAGAAAGLAVEHAGTHRTHTHRCRWNHAALARTHTCYANALRRRTTQTHL
mmetsp:Transcript_52724/g.146374  ORF Transcript_52724/g.146374 Transcript_52724/m.146374 type:complete len:248 (-) Transcript_52724:1005-1748(-)